jgi:D-sedoheptulose 7-phosphate isomerase
VTVRPVVEHLTGLRRALDEIVPELGRIEVWGGEMWRRLDRGGRLLAAGNGGSAAQAQHLTSELVGRFRDDRPPYSAIALHAETSAVTAIANDYGVAEVFSRQVRAHGRPGDVLVTLSTSGRSPNVCEAVLVARELGLLTLALTGPGPNPLADAAHDAIRVGARSTAIVQDVHQALVHGLCLAFEEARAASNADTGPQPA